MGKLIEFRREKLPSKLRKKRKLAADSKELNDFGQVLFFTGVRYESSAKSQNERSRPTARRH